MSRAKGTGGLERGVHSWSNVGSAGWNDENNTFTIYTAESWI